MKYYRKYVERAYFENIALVINKKIVSLIILLSITIFSYNSYASENNYLAFHSVKEQCNKCDMRLFEYGKEQFKSYKFHWLSDDFVIKKTPDYKLTHQNIEKINIKKFENSTGDVVFFVSLLISEDCMASFNQYLMNNNNTKVALKIGDNILNIITVKVDTEVRGFTFSVRDTSYNNLVDILRNLSTKINYINRDSTP